jgi:hypothetical protein
MMVVMEMAVLVLDCLVRMFMGMPFGQMQPDAERQPPSFYFLRKMQSTSSIEAVSTES